jgi:hypothetical protein
MSDESRPWDRLPDETDKAYTAFRAYLDLGRGRSIDKAFHAAHMGNSKSKRSQPHWSAWSSRFNWVDRARAYDKHLIDKAFAEAEDCITSARTSLMEAAQQMVLLLQDHAQGKIQLDRLQHDSILEILNRAGITTIDKHEFEGKGSGVVYPVFHYPANGRES